MLTNCWTDEISLFKMIALHLFFVDFSSRGLLFQLLSFLACWFCNNCLIYLMTEMRHTLRLNKSNVMLKSNPPFEYTLSEISLLSRSATACWSLCTACKTAALSLLVAEWGTVHSRSISCVIPWQLQAVNLKRQMHLPIICIQALGI